MSEPKKFKSNKLTSMYGFKMGEVQLATETGLPAKRFEKLSNVEMCFSMNLYIVESTIYVNGVITRDSQGFHLYPEAQAHFKELKKKHKLKLVDQIENPIIKRD